MGTVRKITGVEDSNRAAEHATAVSEGHFNEAKQALDPFINFGMGAMGSLNQLISNPNSIAESPQYKFDMEQGTNAITRNAAAAGFRGSGNVMYDLTKFASGLASKTYSDEFNRRYGLVQLGQSSASALAGASVQTGNTLANVYSNQGNTAASAQSAFTSGVLGGGSGLGAAFMMGGGGMFSDRRLKTDIYKIGTHSPGINLYMYKYLWNNTPQVGVMADEVEKVIPSAVSEVNGYKVVNYGAL